jgi:RimJ/RimL family protein N-acetyltransferase
MDLTLPIRTERLLLRRFRLDDSGDVYAFQRLPEVARYLLREPWTPEQGREVVAKWAASRFAGQGDELVLAVQLAGGSPVIGEVVLKWASQLARQAEVGYIFHPDYSGHGYATEAAQAMLSAGFTVFGFHRIFARLDAENTASASVCRRLGMRQEAHLIETGFFAGQWASELVFAILRREWEAAQPAER